MRASQLIEKLQALVKRHGDLEVVSGVRRTGYGEAVEAICPPDQMEVCIGMDSDEVEVFDLVLSEESFCCVSGW